MVPTSWRVREGGGAMVLMPWCYAARGGLVRPVGRLPVGTGALSDTAALGDRGMSVLERSCSAHDEGRWCLWDDSGRSVAWRRCGFGAARPCPFLPSTMRCCALLRTDLNFAAGS